MTPPPHRPGASLRPPRRAPNISDYDEDGQSDYLSGSDEGADSHHADDPRGGEGGAGGGEGNIGGRGEFGSNGGVDRGGDEDMGEDEIINGRYQRGGEDGEDGEDETNTADGGDSDEGGDDEYTTSRGTRRGGRRVAKYARPVQVKPDRSSKTKGPTTSRRVLTVDTAPSPMASSRAGSIRSPKSATWRESRSGPDDAESKTYHVCPLKDCPKCPPGEPRRFTRNSDLLRHLRNKRLQCDFCDLTFSRKDALHRHLNNDKCSGRE